MDDTESQLGTSGSEPSTEESAVSFSILHPTRVGRYSIIRRLGKGAFGEVLLGYDEELRRPVAIKVPNPKRISQAGDLDAFLTEARILASLDHPQIVPVYDVGRTEDGRYFIVSKFIDGSDLKTRSEHGRLSLHESVELIRQVAEALHHAHTRGLVHRDIKPANILINKLGQPCVTDFGLALKEADFGSGANIAGTPCYMSPEQARGESDRVDGRSDIFSLGVVFYELLTGRKPFRGKSYEKVLEHITTSEPRPPRQIDDTIPRALEAICLKALSKRVGDRYTTAKDMAEELSVYQQTCGERANRTILSEGLIAQTKPDTRGTARRIEAKGVLGRRGCVFQLSIVCSLLFISFIFTFTLVQYSPTKRPSGFPAPAMPESMRKGKVIVKAPPHPRHPEELPLPDDVFAPPPSNFDRNNEANRLDTLAATYAQAGDFEKAIELQKEANRLYTNEDDLLKGEARLKLYEQRELYREKRK